MAAIIDQAHETKLKMLRFIDILSPMVLKSKADAICRWISYHSWRMKEEMGD